MAVTTQGRATQGDAVQGRAPQGRRARAAVAGLLLAVGGGACSKAGTPVVRATPDSCEPRQSVQANGVTLEYESFGDPAAPPLLLVMGLGMQLTAWDDALVQQLVGRGFRVIRYDNRDVGRSTRFEAAPPPSTARLALWKLTGWAPAVPYSLGDMAEDAAGLLGALGIEKAHVLGVSMGGMIAQELALRHPGKVLTLTSVMSTTGDPSLPGPREDVGKALLGRGPAKSREEALEASVGMLTLIGSPGFPTPPEALRARAGVAYDRCYNPDGFTRQLLAVLTSASRKELLGALKVPTLVVHGREDPLVPVQAGEATAAAIPGAELLVVDGMGHDLPAALQPRLVDAVTRLAARVSPALRAAPAAATASDAPAAQ
jgi:pimeloyl-ACP methyl ester carboxylesterase